MEKYLAIIISVLTISACKNIKKEYYADGKLKSEQLSNHGQTNGYYVSYYEIGRIKDSGSIKDGKLDGFSKSYYENGKLNWEGIFKDGKADGYYKKYYENGNLRTEGFFKDGKPDSVSKEYSEARQLQTKSTWRDGCIVTADHYDSQGRDRKRIYYKDGVRTDYVDFDEDGINLLPSHTIVFPQKDTISLGETYSASILFMEHNLNSLTNRHVFIAQLDSNDNAIGELRELPMVKNEYAVYTEKPQQPGIYNFSGYLEYTKANGHVVRAPFRWSFYVKNK
jgi:hypothetical protein